MAQNGVYVVCQELRTMPSVADLFDWLILSHAA